MEYIFMENVNRTIFLNMAETKFLIQVSSQQNAAAPTKE